MCYNDNMNSGVKVSVLVPIYNVEEFLPECLDSLVRQTLKDIEIICINDGSRDSSLDIIKEYAKKDSRIVVINKKNSGYGDSMNRGLAKASGEYVGIVESDDFIDRDAFEKMYELAKKHDVEIVKGNYYEYYGDGGQDKVVRELFSPGITNRVIDPRVDREVFYQPPSIWAAIYKRTFLADNGIDFLPSPGAAYQDAGFSFKTWAMARRVYIINRAFLHYRQDNANSSVKDSGKVYCVKDEHDSIEKFLIEKKLMDELGSVAFACRFGSYVWNLDRLKFRLAMEFARTAIKDYKRAKRDGYLDYERMDEIGKFIVNQEAVKHPRLHVLRELLHDTGKKCFSVFSKVLWLMFPRYRQRIRTIKYLSELRESQDELILKLAKVKSMLGKDEKNEV